MQHLLRDIHGLLVKMTVICRYSTLHSCAIGCQQRGTRHSASDERPLALNLDMSAIPEMCLWQSQRFCKSLVYTLTRSRPANKPGPQPTRMTIIQPSCAISARSAAVMTEVATASTISKALKIK